MAEESTGLAPEKTDQSYTDDPPQEPEGLSRATGLGRIPRIQEFETKWDSLFARFSQEFETKWDSPLDSVLVHCYQEFETKWGSPFDSAFVHSYQEFETKWGSPFDSAFVHSYQPLISKSIPEKYQHEFETKWNSRSVRRSQDSQISLLSEEMLDLEIETKALLSRRNDSNYLMDKLGENREKFRILTKYVSRIFQGRYDKVKTRQLLKFHKRLNFLMGDDCQWQQSFNSGRVPANSLVPQLSCSPEPKGKAMEVPSCHNSYEDNLDKEWNSPDLCHSNDSQIKMLSKDISNLETEMGPLKDMIDYDKHHTREIQEKLKDLTERVHKIPSFSGCNNPQPELLQRLERLNSLIAGDIKPYSYGEDHSIANDDDHNQASPTSSTTDTDQFTHQLGDKEMQDKKIKEHNEPQMVKNEADKCGHSCSHQHAIDIPPKNETVKDDRETSDRRNAITKLISRSKHYFVSQNIGEELPYFALSVALLVALGNPFDLPSQETSPPLSLNDALFLFRRPIAWSSMFFLISICTAIHVGSRRRVFAVSFLVLFLTYYFLALANTTTGSSVVFGSVTMSSFWFVFGGAALVFVLVILLVIGLSAFLF